MENIKLCAIGQENIIIPYILPCNHVFEKENIEQWLINNNNCPLCRRDIHDDEYEIDMKNMEELFKKLDIRTKITSYKCFQRLDIADLLAVIISKDPEIHFEYDIEKFNMSNYIITNKIRYFKHYAIRCRDIYTNKVSYYFTLLKTDTYKLKEHSQKMYNLLYDEIKAYYLEKDKKEQLIIKQFINKIF